MRVHRLLVKAFLDFIRLNEHLFEVDNNEPSEIAFRSVRSSRESISAHDELDARLEGERAFMLVAVLDDFASDKLLDDTFTADHVILSV